MIKPSAFWDASALVPFCVAEPPSAQLRSLMRRFKPIVWWGTVAEVRSAICRLHREGVLHPPQKVGACARLDLLSQRWNEILPEDDVRDMACSLLDKYPLRAGDSLQLAAALKWCQHRPQGRTFISLDKKLNHAAAAAGFSVSQF